MTQKLEDSVLAYTEEERKSWNDAIDAVLELLRTRPPHRMGEAEFMRRLVAMKVQKKK